jgi:Cdc6-like AAA superfamily ATPase
MESEEFDNGEGNAVLQRSYFDQLTQSISSESFPEQKRPDMNFMNFAQKGFDKISKSVRVISDRGIHIFESSSDPDVDNIDDLHEENVFESIAIAFKRLKTVAIE